LDGLIEHPNISRPTHSQQIWRQKIFGCRSTSLEWPSTWSTTACSLDCHLRLSDDNCRLICPATAVHRDSYYRI